MARHRLSTHENVAAGAPLPPLDLLTPLIDQDESTGGHWYWRGAFSTSREPLFSWAPPAASGGPRSKKTRYAVARLLLQLQGSCVPGAGVLNECGLVQCVNPAHWSIETRSDRGRGKRIVVMADFHGKGWTNVTRTEMCEVCFQPPGRPCDPRGHDAEFRRVLDKSEERCDVCNAAPYQDCDETVHRQVFVHALSKPSLARTNIAGPDHIVHRATCISEYEPRKYVRACSRHDPIGVLTSVVGQAELTSAPVNCIACLGSS